MAKPPMGKIRVMSGVLIPRQMTPLLPSSFFDDLAYSYLPYGAKGEEDRIQGLGYIITADGDAVAPRNYALKTIRDLIAAGRIHEDSIDFGDESSAILLPKLPSSIVLREDQVEPVDKIVGYFDSGRVYDCLLQARPGAGKTIMAAQIAIRLGLGALIFVDQTNLVPQWVSAFKLAGVPASKIGVVGGGSRDYHEKYVLVVMVQSFLSNRIPDAILNKYLYVVYDESHTTAGAASFATSMFYGNALYRLRVSATPRKQDAQGKIAEKHTGNLRVIHQTERMANFVRIVDYAGTVSAYADKAKIKGRYITELSEDGKRNFLAALIVKEFWEEGRTILVVGDRTEQLYHLSALIQYMGIPEAAIGLHCGERYSFQIEKDPKPRWLPYGANRGGKYTPIRYSLVKAKQKQEDLEAIRATKEIILATSMTFRKGVDVVRLSGGIDLTPEAQATQVVGRLLRQCEGKLTPVWATIRDIYSVRAEGLLLARIKDYVEIQSEIQLWQPGETPKTISPDDLITMVTKNKKRLEKMTPNMIELAIRGVLG